MKTKQALILAALTSVLTYCKSSKSTTGSASATAAPAETVAADLKAAAEARYPGIAVADIAEGQKLYVGKCGKCHGLPTVESETEEKWPKIMNWMAPKANMDEAQKEKTLKYVLSARDIKVKK